VSGVQIPATPTDHSKRIYETCTVFSTDWGMVLARVVAINGSAKMENGNTALVLASFLDGVREAGASVELFYVKRLNVKPCTGEFYCWNKKPGECYINDDMQVLYPKLREADMLVLATPVYIPLPGEMQNLINRLCPLVEPILEFQDGRTRARFHDDVNIRKIVLVSTCGWWEIGNFGTVLRIAEELAKDVSVEFAGAVLRPHAYLMVENKEKAKKVTEALRQAGYELMKKGRMSKSLLEVISQPLVSEEEYKRSLNEAYEKVKSGEKD
jgi:multimeric flavodoxin WrbA